LKLQRKNEPCGQKIFTFLKPFLKVKTKRDERERERGQGESAREREREREKHEVVRARGHAPNRRRGKKMRRALHVGIINELHVAPVVSR